MKWFSPARLCGMMFAASVVVTGSFAAEPTVATAPAAPVEVHGATGAYRLPTDVRLGDENASGAPRRAGYSVHELVRESDGTRAVAVVSEVCRPDFPGLNDMMRVGLKTSALGGVSVTRFDEVTLGGVKTTRYSGDSRRQVGADAVVWIVSLPQSWATVELVYPKGDPIGAQMMLALEAMDFTCKNGTTAPPAAPAAATDAG
ncbi:hypothetical protein [Arenimonas oryziterrae]|uniref:Uncharacterized protein n=1 Tax=Arenimonas oryziterrae DSM 21050 = YC6267 TaxID=1121015 RepID=A0A091AVV2_9GAMM|nr:hypothetical protein [Arenimonas oryziterrae]KFN43387.1 hypothetical protein N789_08920 [Arenimonas oryziterrae DSM 21050 = YC6267]